METELSAELGDSGYATVNRGESIPEKTNLATICLLNENEE